MKVTFTILIALAATGLLQAQSFYFKTGAGYSFPSSPRNMGINSSTMNIMTMDADAGHYVSSIALRYSEVKGSLGAGLSFSALLGTEVHRNIAVEVRFDYIDGKEYQSTDYNADITDGAIVNSSTSDLRQYANSFQVAPLITFFSDLDGFRPYLSAGPVFARVKAFEEEAFSSDYDGDDSQRFRKEVYSGGTAVGVTGSAGIEKKINERLSIFAECTYVSLSYFPAEGNIERYEVNNEDRLSTLSMRQKKTVFTHEYVVDSRTPINRDDLPGKAIRFSFALDRITATAGVKVKIFSKS